MKSMMTGKEKGKEQSDRVQPDATLGKCHEVIDKQNQTDLGGHNGVIVHVNVKSFPT